MAQYILLSLVSLALLDQPAIVQAQENCNTALTRIAKKAAEKAIADHRDNACAGLKKGPFGIDKTRALELRKFSLCETGPVVVASITVHVWYATSDRAVLKADLEDDITATASANLDTCQVLNTDVSSKTFIVETGIRVAELEKKLRDAAEKEIKDYCK
jgi:hypothetical protein